MKKDQSNKGVALGVILYGRWGGAVNCSYAYEGAGTQVLEPVEGHSACGCQSSLLC